MDFKETVIGNPIYVQAEADVALPFSHLNKASTLQLEEHPSPSIKFPSSQDPYVFIIRNPSPQVSEQRLSIYESPAEQTQ